LLTENPEIMNLGSRLIHSDSMVVHVYLGKTLFSPFEEKREKIIW